MRVYERVGGGGCGAAVGDGECVAEARRAEAVGRVDSAAVGEVHVAAALELAEKGAFGDAEGGRARHVKAAGEVGEVRDVAHER